MFDLGIGEILVIGVFALIFVGPRDFTKMFRELGKFTAKLRRMARDFQRAMEDAADETGMKETAKDLRAMTSSKNLGLDKLNETVGKFDKWDSDKPSGVSKKFGSETEKLSEERAEAARKVREATAAKATARKDAEAAKKVEAAAPAKAASKATSAKTAKPKAAKPTAAKPKVAKPAGATPKAAKAASKSDTSKTGTAS
jgi:sec-independent protein translocase protein TatB